MPAEVEEDIVDPMDLLNLIDVTPPYLRLSSLEVDTFLFNFSTQECYHIRMSSWLHGLALHTAGARFNCPGGD